MRLPRMVLLQYALDGVRTAIGSHPCPHEYPDEILEYEQHLAAIAREMHRIQARTPETRIALARESSPTKD